ncbi:unnamed protein product [Rotaria sp. Silwood1]|nr:unnamed protein product [Rotaria sp. Silwood1]CAF1631919.1 unnamed protein product [Rotaria sp. Silwood1]
MGRAAGGVTRCIPLRPTLESAQGGISSSADWTLDYEKLESMFNERTRLIIVNTPNNPLGKNGAYVIPTVTQEVVARCFEHEEKRFNLPECFFNSISTEFIDRRDRLAKALCKCGMKPIVPDGGYFLVADISGVDFYLYTSWSYKKVFNLAPQFTEAYSKESTTSAQLNETFHVGDYSACTINDKDWDRGVIRQLDSKGFATIFRIDYGDVQRIRVQFLRPFKINQWTFQTYRLAHHCTLSNIIKPINGWSSNVIDEFRAQLNRSNLYARFLNYNEIREISEVEIRVKGSTKTVNKDFERYQMEQSAVQINDQHVYQNIPMKILDCTRPNVICMLYYISPTRFYVYLKEKFDSHTSFQIDLQKSIQNLHTLSSPVKYQAIAVQNKRALWHRAIILEVAPNLLNVCVYFFDIGHIECITINNIHQLPQEFRSKPAFSIPCCLYNVCPINGNEQSIWKLDDKVYDEFIRLMVNTYREV